MVEHSAFPSSNHSPHEADHLFSVEGTDTHTAVAADQLELEGWDQVSIGKGPDLRLKIYALLVLGEGI